MDFPKLSEYIQKNETLLKSSSSEAEAERFISTLKELFSFLNDLNDYAHSELGSHPVSPLLISIASTAMGSFGSSTKGKAVDVFIERAIDEKEMIFGRNVPGLRAKAFSLFEDIPKPVIDTVVKLLDESLIPQESIGDVFGFVETLFKVSLRREILKIFEKREASLVVTKEQIEKTIGTLL